MLLSVRENTPGYDEWLGLMSEGKSITVLLDDKEVTSGITLADDVAGYVLRLVVDDAGDPVTVNDYLQFERVEGKVEIRIE